MPFSKFGLDQLSFASLRVSDGKICYNYFIGGRSEFNLIFGGANTMLENMGHRNGVSIQNIVREIDSKTSSDKTANDS